MVDVNKMKTAFSILLYTTVSFGQIVTLSKDTLNYPSKYPFYPKFIDTIHVYNSGIRTLSIDSVQLFSSSYRNYLFSVSSHDSVRKIGNLRYQFRIISGITILPSDSALFIFQYTPPVTKLSVNNAAQSDSLVFYNNSLNRPLMTISLINEIPSYVDNPISLPSNYILYQNYPNPFNPSTQIAFYLPVRTQVSIIVCDVHGRVINKLIDKELPMGTHSLVWNAHGCCSGIYFYTLKTQSICLSKAMLFIK